MKKLRLLVVSSLIAATALLAAPVQHAAACAPDPDGVDPCQRETCYKLNKAGYKVFGGDWLTCSE